MPHVVIAGGGLTGLSVAFRLRQLAPDVRVTVLEPRPRVGGNVSTVDRDGFRVECGPNGFLDSKPFTARLCRDIGLGDRMLAASEGARKNRYVFLRDRMWKLPASPLGILATGLLGARGKLALLSEPFRRARPPGPDVDESVAEFARRRFGVQAADVFVDALVTGIHGGDPAALSVRAAFPRLPLFEAEYGSVLKGFIAAAKKRKADAVARGDPPPGPPQMWSFRTGLQTLVDALAERLGDAVMTGAVVRRVERRADGGWRAVGDGQDAWDADAVVLASPSYEQAPALADLDPALAEEVSGITYNRIAVVALGYRRPDCPGEFDGFGYIAPQNTRRDVLGVQWCSSIFPDRAPPGFVLWRALCGGVHRAEQVDWDDDRLARAVHEEIRQSCGVKGDPVFRHVVRWPRAIPQYVVGHPARVARIDAAVARHPGLFLTGNAYRGVALNDCTEQGETVAAAVAGHLGRAVAAS